MTKRDVYRIILAWKSDAKAVRRRCLSSCESGKEGCTKLPRGITRREGVHITTVTILLSILSAIGSIASIISLALYIRDRKRK